MLQRSITGSGTTITVYAFGSEEHVYNASGAKLSDTYYYMLGGRLLGQYNGVTTQFYLTDALGSVVSTFDDTVGSAAILGNQAYGPYGKKIYSAGSMGTNKGYTGQYQDATGLDYYNARYYDQVMGRFVSADSVQGNTSGMDPYDYVGGNPETATDPTGQRIDWGGGEQTIVNWSAGTATTFETQQAVDPTQTDFWGAGAPYQYYKPMSTADGGRQDVFHFSTKVSNPYNTHPVGATIKQALGITQMQHGDVVGGLEHGASNIFQLCMILCGGGEVDAVGIGAEQGGALFLDDSASTFVEDRNELNALASNAESLRAAYSGRSGGAMAGAAANILKDTGYLNDIARGPREAFDGIVNLDRQGGGQCAECHLAVKIVKFQEEGGTLPEVLKMVESQKFGKGPCPACQANLPALLGPLGVPVEIYNITNLSFPALRIP